MNDKMKELRNYMDSGCLPLGIENLDKNHLNGLPRGSLVSVLGGSMTPAGQLLSQIAVNNWVDVLYLGVGKSEEELSYELEYFLGVSSLVGEERLEDISIMSHRGGAGIDKTVRSLVDRLDEGSVLIVDTATGLYDSNSEKYHELVRDIRSEIIRADGLAYLYFPVDNVDDLYREEREVLHKSDSLLSVEQGVETGGELVTKLKFNKLRGKSLDKRVFNLDVGESINLASTRDL